MFFNNNQKNDDWNIPQDENGKPYYFYEEIELINGKENMGYQIIGDLSHRPDTIKNKDIPVGSRFVDWANGTLYWMTNTGWKKMGD